MHTAAISTLLLACLTAPAAALQSSEIHVIGQDGAALEIVVSHSGSQNATLRIVDGTDVEETRVPAQADHRHRYSIAQKGEALAERSLSLELIDHSGDPLDLEQATVVTPLELPDAPLLTLTADELLDLRKAHVRDARVRPVLDQLIARNERRLGNRLLVPKTGGAWTQRYRCPQTHLRLEMIDFHHHRSPATGQVYTGTPYDECITTYRHTALGVQAFEMALCYQLTGDLRFAERAEEILLNYALLYPGYELHDRHGTTKKDAGRAFAESLKEAQWMVDLARARDLLRGSGLIDAAERHQLDTQLFRPAMDVVAKNQVGILNIQNWHNSALFLTAVQCGDFVTARDVLFGPFGLEEQLRQGVQADGLWMEGSIGYHFFAVKAILPLVQALERCAVTVDYAPLQAMFTAPFDLIQPDFTLPMLNDGAQEDFEIALRDEYEQAVALFGQADPRLDDPMAIFGRGRTLAAILWGADTLGEDDWQDVGSVHFADSGLAVLRSGTPERRSMALLDHGPHGGPHGHYDKLGVTLWMQGQEAVRESGADGYGTPLSEDYFPSTLAHSTVVVDGVDQDSCAGVAGYFDTAAGTTITASADDAYPGVRQRRLVHLTEEGHCADLFEAVGSGAHTFDYVLHFRGTASTDLPLAPGTAGFGGAYGFLKQVQVGTPDGAFEVTFTDGSRQTTVRVLGAPGTQVLLASSPGYPLGTQHPVLIVRRTGDRAVFATAISEGPSLAPGFDVFLDDDGFEPAIEVSRPGVADLRRLDFLGGAAR